MPTLPLPESESRALTFSVIVPAFRAESSIRATIESLLAQTYRVHEIIVVDDGSPDATADVVATFGAPVSLIRQANAGNTACGASSGTQVKSFTALRGAQLPAPFLAGLEKCGADDAAATEFGIEYASAQCANLFKNGVEGIHYYTLNKAHSTTRILQNLKLA